MADDTLNYPLHVFRFRVDFEEVPASGKGPEKGTAVPLCSGLFSECSGLEATMEPKVIQAGGHNYGAVQRAGPVTFATVILKRGLTASRHLWQWFEFVTAKHAYAYRLRATITLMDAAANPRLVWELERALPVKFKGPDLNAAATEVGIEELHIAHEGLRLRPNR
jgi:phage tail-like protein